MNPPNTKPSKCPFLHGQMCRGGFSPKPQPPKKKKCRSHSHSFAV